MRVFFHSRTKGKFDWNNKLLDVDQVPAVGQFTYNELLRMRARGANERVALVNGVMIEAKARPFTPPYFYSRPILKRFNRTFRAGSTQSYHRRSGPGGPLHALACIILWLWIPEIDWPTKLVKPSSLKIIISCYFYHIRHIASIIQLNMIQSDMVQTEIGILRHLQVRRQSWNSALTS